jgi:hypothetical protein
MMDSATIAHLCRQAARKAAREHRLPLLVEAEDCVSPAVLREHLERGIPNFGDYRPKGWEVVPRVELKSPESWSPNRLRYLGCDDDYVFVDSSGWGGRGEPALGQSEFFELVAANPGLGWATVEAGQFQVVVGAFRRAARRRTA